MAPFSVDVENNLVRIGDGADFNGTLSLYASDGDTGNLLYNTSDQFQFSGGDVVIDQALTVGDGFGSTGVSISTTGNIQVDGTVGIGTGTPLATLDVRGNVATTPVAGRISKEFVALANGVLVKVIGNTSPVDVEYVVLINSNITGPVIHQVL